MEKEQGKRSFRQRLMGFRPKNLKDYLLAVAVLFKWMLLAVGIGLIVGSISALFGHTLIFVNNLRAQHPWIIYTLPVGGLLIVLLYRGCRNTSDKGTNTVVASIQESTDIPFKMAPLIFVSTTITQLCGGSAGREGAGFKGGEIVPSFTIGAALGCTAATVMGMPVEQVAACGMVGLFCGVTNSPITSLLIAFELFGFAGMPYYLITIAVSYMLSGYHSLYHKQKIVYSKTRTSFEPHIKEEN